MTVDIIGSARTLLQDTDATNYVWPTTVLETFRDAAVRRLAPITARRAATVVTNLPGVVEYSLVATLGAAPLEVEGVVIGDGYEFIGWSVYGDVLSFEVAPTTDFTVKSVLPYTSYTQLPDTLADAVAQETASKALDYLLRRGGKALSRYLVDQGELQSGEIRSMAEYFHQEFLSYREEWGVGLSKGLG
jgi:hypothetical protein